MKISTTLIKEYLLEKFTDYRISETEFITNSIFYDDHGKHMSVNLETGLWQCFRTKEAGDFIQLISFRDSISYDEAFKSIGKKLISDPGSLLYRAPAKQKELESAGTLGDEMKNFKPLVEIDGKSGSVSELLAKRFVRNRRLPESKFYFASSGRYANRLIIPYEDEKGIFYFQARHLVKIGMKYLNPTHRDHGVRSSEILYPCSSNTSYVVLTEGPIDAMTLQCAGVNATSIQGSSLSRHQLLELKNSFTDIVLSFDNDDAGMFGMRKSLNLTKCLNMPTPYIVQPPKRFKDWNDFYLSTTKSGIRNYINGNVRKLDYKYTVIEGLREMGHS